MPKVIWIWLGGQLTSINHSWFPVLYWKTNCFLPSYHCLHPGFLFTALWKQVHSWNQPIHVLIVSIQAFFLYYSQQSTWKMDFAQPIWQERRRKLALDWSKSLPLDTVIICLHRVAPLQILWGGSSGWWCSFLISVKAVLPTLKKLW